MRFIFFLLFFLFIFTSCGAAPPPEISSSLKQSDQSTCPSQGNHHVFAIRIDGADVGREVRSTIFEDGPAGKRRFVLSHSVKNEKLGSVLFQNTFIRQEITDYSTGALIYSTFTKKDQVATHVVQISLADDTYNRKIFSTSSFSEPTHPTEDSVSLSGQETIGFNLLEKARACFDKHDDCVSLSFFDAQLKNPVRLRLTPPFSSSLQSEGRTISGSWVEVQDELRNAVRSRYFFDDSGTLIFEEYPEFHESRVLLSGPFSFPADTSELLVGLRSNSYIYDPNIASSATYELIASPDRLDKLDMLSDPKNHRIERVSENRILLHVESGAPDKSDPPIDADLASSMYIRPDDPDISGALTYLKSGGKSGHLDESRMLNATPVIAQISLLHKPAKIWSDPDQSAALIMQYTSSLLPDKRHTFSMSDAVTTLKNGSGDCTEHAVLFASLMRANKIPTRLVTGMLLTPGGLWAYHMWNAYWDGDNWRAIDPSTLTFRPGALYVSLGTGASYFKQVRDRLADFMWRTFSGVAFNLIEASNNGEALFLAKPVGHEKDLGETALFNAVVLSGRGNHEGALALLDDHIDESARTVSVRLMRIELLLNAGKYDEALDNIRFVRNETSSADNTFLLDNFEFKCLLRLGKLNDAKTLLSEISKRLDDPSDLNALEAEYLFYAKELTSSLSLLKKTLSENSDHLDSLADFSRFVSLSEHPSIEDVSVALEYAFKAVRLSYFSESEYLKTLARLLFISGDHQSAVWFSDHALTLSPDDTELRSFIKDLPDLSTCLY